MPKTISEQTVGDIENLCQYIFDTEGEDFSEFLAGNPEFMPSQDDDPTAAEVWDKSALNPDNMHIYAVASRVWQALIKKK
jgi:hypothetical protein